MDSEYFKGAYDRPHRLDQAGPISELIGNRVNLHVSLNAAAPEGVPQ